MYHTLFLWISAHSFSCNWRTLTTKSTFRTSGLWSICKCMPMPAVFNFVHILIISMLALFFAQHFLPQSFIQPFSPPFPLPLFSLPWCFSVWKVPVFSFRRGSWLGWIVQTPNIHIIINKYDLQCTVYIDI